MGSWGRVYAGRFHGSRVAIKEVIESNDIALKKDQVQANEGSQSNENEQVKNNGVRSEQAVRSFNAEADILMRLHHSAVIELFGICVAPSGLLLIVTEFCELDLTTLIARGRQQQRYLGMYDAILWRDLANQMCSGMRYLHAQNIMHRDLKPDNIVLVPLAPGPGGAQRYQAKICDFGISKHVKDTQCNVHHTRAVGTPVYMAPEVMLGARREALYSLKSDVYSYGILLWTLWCGCLPYDDLEDSLLGLMTAVTRGVRPLFHADHRWPHGVVSLIQYLWQHSPHARPSFEQLQQSGMLSFDSVFLSEPPGSDYSDAASDGDE
eukprot:g1329.t1